IFRTGMLRKQQSTFSYKLLTELSWKKELVFKENEKLCLRSILQEIITELLIINN
ncbi:MAG: hypothetical protein F6K48_27140, partial [Okeania sp. SIO3H1]|nr:hypothetical protein [Okeania sp. SIO3H1]